MNPTDAWFGTSGKLLLSLIFVLVVIPPLSAIAFHLRSASTLGTVIYNLLGVVVIGISTVLLCEAQLDFSKILKSLVVFAVLIAIVFLREKGLQEPNRQALVRKQNRISLWLLGFAYSLHWIAVLFVRMIRQAG